MDFSSANIQLPRWPVVVIVFTSQEDLGSTPGCRRPESLELVLVAFPLGTQDYGKSTVTGLPMSE